MNASIEQDNPEYDGTDAAHPAWWRGSDHATKVLTAEIERLRAALHDFVLAAEEVEVAYEDASRYTIPRAAVKGLMGALVDWRELDLANSEPKQDAGRAWSRRSEGCHEAKP